MAWKETVTDFTANVISDLSYVDIASDIGIHEASPNMPLQMFMYLNVYFFPFWFINSTIFLYLKYESLGNLTRILVVPVMIMTSIIECIRLYLGYLGNLSERIPELAGCWMLSVLLQLPLQTFLLTNPYLLPKPVEVTINAVMWLLLLAETVSGFFALRAAATRAKQFYTLKSHLRKLAIKDNGRKTDNVN